MPEEWRQQDLKYKECVVEYRFFNPSLGPINGKRSFRVLLNKGKVEKVIDLQTGKSADPDRGTPGLRKVLSILGGESDASIDSHYDGDRNVLIVRPKERSRRAGGGYRLELSNVHCKD